MPDPTPGDHLDQLFRAAWALCGSREQAEDLVQDAYARVPTDLHNEDSLGFLLGALRDNFICSRRATRPRRPAAAGRESEVQQVFAAIATLPSELRDALVAIDVAQLSYGRAATVLRMREAALASRVFRARNELRKSLSRSSL